MVRNCRGLRLIQGGPSLASPLSGSPNGDLSPWGGGSEAVEGGGGAEPIVSGGLSCASMLCVVRTLVVPLTISLIRFFPFCNHVEVGQTTTGTYSSDRDFDYLLKIVIVGYGHQ